MTPQQPNRAQQSTTPSTLDVSQDLERFASRPSATQHVESDEEAEIDLDLKRMFGLEIPRYKLEDLHPVPVSAPVEPEPLERWVVDAFIKADPSQRPRLEALMAKHGVVDNRSNRSDQAPTTPTNTKPKKAKKKPPSQSKRQVNARLPRDYREQMLSLAKEAYERQPLSNRGYFYPAFLILCATGLRPSEIARGHQQSRGQGESASEMQPTGEVGVTYGIENGQLWVQIFSTKFEKEENGQVVRGLEWRKIYLNKEYSKANEELYAFVENSAQVELAIHYNADTLRRQVNRLGKKYLISKGILPTRELSISPYSLRHEVASDLKSAEGVSSRDIAAVLGHLSEKSASRYGRKRRGKKTPIKPIIRVECHPEPKADLRIGTRPFDKSAANPNQSKQTGPGF